MAYESEAKRNWYSSSGWYKKSDDEWPVYAPSKAWDAGSGGTVGGETAPSKGGKGGIGGKGDKNVGTTEVSEHERSELKGEVRELKGEVRELKEEIRVLKKEAREMKEEVRVLSDLFSSRIQSSITDAGQGSGQRYIPDAGQGSGQSCGWHGKGSSITGCASVGYADTEAAIESVWISFGATIGYELVREGGQHAIDKLLWARVEANMANLQLDWCSTKANKNMVVQCRHCKQGLGAKLDKDVSISDKRAFLLKLGAFFKIEEAVKTTLSKEEVGWASAAELPKI
jgi:hypothetical protein